MVRLVKMVGGMGDAKFMGQFLNFKNEMAKKFREIVNTMEKEETKAEVISAFIDEIFKKYYANYAKSSGTICEMKKNLKEMIVNALMNHNNIFYFTLKILKILLFDRPDGFKITFNKCRKEMINLLDKTIINGKQVKIFKEFIIKPLQWVQ